MARIELSVEATHDAVDWVTMAAVGCGFGADEVRVEAIDATEGSPWAYLIHFALAPGRSPDAAARDLERALRSLGRAGLVGDLYLEERDGPAATDAQPVRIGDHWVVLNATQALASAPDDHALRIARAQAFGTGLHPTTRLVLRLLEGIDSDGVDALDLGSGTGILSVALARRGARVLALDNDPEAVAATRATVALNGVEDAVTVAAGSLGAGAMLGHWMGDGDAVLSDAVGAEQRFDLVVANVFARIHDALAADYRRVLRDGGTLVVSGFTEHYAEQVADRVGDHGFAPVTQLVEGEWIAMVFGRRP